MSIIPKNNNNQLNQNQNLKQVELYKQDPSIQRFKGV
jgi:hypothetical protein